MCRKKKLLTLLILMLIVGLIGCVAPEKELTSTLTPTPHVTKTETTATTTPHIKNYTCIAVDSDDADKYEDTARVSVEIATDCEVRLDFKLIDSVSGEVIQNTVKYVNKRGVYTADLILIPEHSAKTYTVEIDLIRGGKTVDSAVQEVFLYPLGYGVIKLETKTTYYSTYPLAFYNTFYELHIPNTIFKITNAGDWPVTVKVTSEYQSYSQPAITIDVIMPGEEKTINQTIPLTKEKIEQIKTKTKFSFYYKIEYKENGEWKILG